MATKIQNIINYQDILASVKEKHNQFIDKFSGSIDKALSDFKMEVDLTYARLSFVAKILKDAKVISNYKETEVMVEGTCFFRSITLTVDYGICFVYLLNSGRNVFVYEGVALAHPGNLSFLVWSQNDQTKKFCDVLSEDFDWKQFVLYVADVIHKSSYRRKEVIDNAIG
jgi:hypothetical protein